MTGLYDIPIDRIDGSKTSLGEYKGKVMLVVNVASKCGLTPQYDALEKLYKDKKVDGLVVLGFPANNFKGQEPGTNSEIQEFCRSTYGVDFPMFSKIDVTGDNTHPLYKSMIKEQPKATAKENSELTKILEKIGETPKNPSDVLWNFEKFLIGRDGKVAARFAPDIAPDDAAVTKAIDAELAKK
jgi:glutathione peroxidase